MIEEVSSLGPLTGSASLAYVDKLRIHTTGDAATQRAGRRWGHQWCHLWADNLATLHAAAAAVGMRREWFQDGRFPHYDLTPARRAAALAAGLVVEKSLKEWLAAGRRATPNVPVSRREQ